MLLDFLQQFLYASVFFFGMAGVGYLVLKSLGYSQENQLFNLSLAYFTSLCLYTVTITVVLFIAPDKRGGLLISTLVYGIVSLCVIVYQVKRWRSIAGEFFLQNRVPVFSFLIVFSLAVFLFFLQIYHTAILDEWLHRPVVQSFVDNGVFPLVNPLDPNTDYIHSYHYGTQIIAAALQLVFRLDVSTSLDLLKMSYFIATFLLFYGLIYGWTKKWQLSLMGAALVLFCGSSFFFLDSFTANHLISFSGLELIPGQRWSVNSPLSYALSGITWVNVPLIVSLAFLIDTIWSRKSSGVLDILKTSSYLGIMVIGFFLISELFAAVLVLVYVVLKVCNSFSSVRNFFRSGIELLLFGLIIIAGVYTTGGIVAGMIESTVDVQRIESGKEVEQRADSEVPVQHITRQSSFLSFKSPGDWGYPSEKHILGIVGMPLYYLRSFFLEFCILGLLIYAFITSNQKFGGVPISVWLVIGIGFVVPMILSTSYGDINLAKLLAPGIVLIHLLVFYWFGQDYFRNRIYIRWAFLGVFMFGSVPGMLMGPNIQWQLISKKGKEQYCSQNPVCYKGEFTDLLRRFENEHPGLKRIQTDQKNASKIADLTNSYVYRRAIPGVVEYVIETPELRKVSADRIGGELLYESGEYRIWRIN